MTTAMADLGPHGKGMWHNDSVGLGHRLYHNTPEAVNETQPLKSTDGNLILTAQVRIDNRDELFRKLGIPTPLRAEMPDGALVLKAYEKWGEDCPKHLLGDWAFAVWDAHEQKLFIARDHQGESRLVYYHTPKIFAFATSLNALLAVPEIPKTLNKNMLGQGLARLGQWLTEDTFYDGIHYLCVAHALTINNRKMNLRRYWFPESVPDLYLSSDEEYQEAFLSYYTEAIKCRLRSLLPVGATLSGGLDSGSVVALAAPELHKRGQKLTAFSSIPRNTDHLASEPHSFNDESPFIQATSEHVGNIDLHYVRATKTSSLEAMKRLMLHFGESYGNENGCWMVEILDQATQHGIGTLLTGQGGNSTVSWNGRNAYLSSLVKQKQWRTLWHETRSWQTLKQCPLFSALKSQLIRTLLPSSVLMQYDAFKHRNLAQKISALNPNLEKQITPFLNKRKQERQIDRSQSIAGQTLRTLWGQSAIWQWCKPWPVCGVDGRLEVRDPTLDARIIEFCISVPEEQWAKDGQDRLLIRRAMKQKLPPKVLWNNQRGLQTADIVWRLQEDMAALRKTCTQLSRSSLAQKYIDLPKITNILHILQTRPPLEVPNDHIRAFYRGIMIGVFLLHFECSDFP